MKIFAEKCLPGEGRTAGKNFPLQNSSPVLFDIVVINILAVEKKTEKERGNIVEMNQDRNDCSLIVYFTLVA